MTSTLSSQVIRAVIYARVSSDRAKGRSVAEQETECRAECDRRGWPVAHVLTGFIHGNAACSVDRIAEAWSPTFQQSAGALTVVT